MSEHTLICGVCGEAAVYRDPENSDDVVGCPDCNNWANKNEAINIAGEHAKATIEVALTKTTKDVVRGSPMTSVTGRESVSGNYLFKLQGF